MSGDEHEDLLDPEDPLVIDRRRSPGHIPPELVERMVANSENLITEAMELRDEITAVRTRQESLEKDQHRDRLIYVALAVTVIFVIGALVVVGVLNRRTVLDAKEQLSTSSAQLKVIKDCLTPGSTCSKQQAKQTADLLGEPAGPVNTVAVAASACGAAHPGDVTATARCVRLWLKAQGEGVG